MSIHQVSMMDVERIRAGVKSNIEPFFTCFEKDMEKYNYRPELIVLILFIYLFILLACLFI
jgi:hypothetical protein